MPGIKRIAIKNHNIGRGAKRLRIPRMYSNVTGGIYRNVFDLEPGDIEINASKYSNVAKIDYEYGIDLILAGKAGGRMTVQEKILTTTCSFFGKE